MSTLYLFRHGQSEYNLQKIFSGWLDPDLTPLGVEQAKALGLLLKDKKIDLAYTSSLIRAKKTLDQVLAFHPECKQTIVDNRIIERSYGDLAGKKHAEVIDIYGVDQFQKWHRGWSDQPPHGESFADVQVRVKEFIKDIRHKYSHQDLGIAISAHGNSIRLFRKIMEKASEEEVCSWDIPYDKYFEYKI